MSKIIATLTLAQLVATYNNLAAVVDCVDVRKFSSKEKGAERVAKMLDRVNEHRYAEKLPLIEVVDGGKLVAVEPPAPKKLPATKSASQPKTKKKSVGRIAAVGPSDLIVLLVAEGTNPKFAKAAERFANFATGIRVSDYVAALGGDKKQALRDINWDKKQNWIQVVGAKSAAAKGLAAKIAATTEEVPPSPRQLLLSAPAPLLMIAGPTVAAA